jgi:hypothetical protein
MLQRPYTRRLRFRFFRFLWSKYFVFAVSLKSTQFLPCTILKCCKLLRGSFAVMPRLDLGNSRYRKKLVFGTCWIFKVVATFSIPLPTVWTKTTQGNLRPSRFVPLCKVSDCTIENRRWQMVVKAREKVFIGFTFKTGLEQMMRKRFMGDIIRSDTSISSCVISSVVWFSEWWSKNPAVINFNW